MGSVRERMEQISSSGPDRAVTTDHSTSKWGTIQVTQRIENQRQVSYLLSCSCGSTGQRIFRTGQLVSLSVRSRQSHFVSDSRCRRACVKRDGTRPIFRNGCQRRRCVPRIEMGTSVALLLSYLCLSCFLLLVLWTASAYAPQRCRRIRSCGWVRIAMLPALRVF